MSPADIARIRVTQAEKVAFDNLDLEGENQREKFRYLISEYARLKALEATSKLPNVADNYSVKKQMTVDSFLEGIPDDVLFNKDGEYKGKSLKGYPNIVKLRVQRLYETLLEINATLEPDKQVEISCKRIRILLNSNAYSTKDAWEQLELEPNEQCRDKLHTWDELIALEKKTFPESNYSILEMLYNQSKQ